MDALSELLSLPPEQKVARGLDHTPAEIAQQPDTWLSTYRLFHARRTEIKEFLSRSGVDTHSSSNVTIFLVRRRDFRLHRAVPRSPSARMLAFGSARHIEHGSADTYG